MKKFKIFALLFLCLLVLANGISVEAAEEERYGGTLIFPLAYGSPGYLDPAEVTRVEGEIITSNIFDRLVRIDPETLTPVPLIAESWDVSDDGLEYTFYLHEGIKFHDGSELTASDVKFSFERVMNPDESLNTDLLHNVEGATEFRDGESDYISGIEVINDYEIKLTLESLDVDFLLTVARRGSEIVPEKAVTELGDDFSDYLIGSGPFKFVSWIEGAAAELEAFDDYFRGRPYLDELIFRDMEEAAARVPSFLAEEIDFDIVFPAQFEIYAEDPVHGDNMVIVPELWTRHVHFNLEVEKLQDKRVRQAFNYAVDKELIIDRLVDGMAFPATGWLPESSPGFNHELEGYEYNPEKAASLMEEAGYSPGNPLELEIFGTTSPHFGVPIIEAMTPFLEEVGFDITPVQMEGATISDYRMVGDFEAYIQSHGGEISPVEYLRKHFWSGLSRSEGRWSMYENPEFDEYIELAMRTIDEEERLEYVHRAEEIIVEDAPVFFYNYSQAVGVFQPWVHGIVENPLELSLQPFENIWVDDSSPRK